MEVKHCLLTRYRKSRHLQMRWANALSQRSLYGQVFSDENKVLGSTTPQMQA
jgi:hypothetical protein